MGKATDDLRKEHESILYVLKILDQMMLAENGDLQKRLDYYSELIFFLKSFVDQCHHGKEENYLFKEVALKEIPKEGDLVGVMLQEHEKGREYMTQMSSLLSDKKIDGFNEIAGLYRDLLRSHIEKENQVLFPLADEAIGEQEQDLLFEKFEEHEEHVIGHGVHEKLHAMIDRWAQQFLR